ncbi:WbqC family protein [Streptomyces olivoreticuli]|uniref:WbqC family protein n=1 Tax=Streptomyces sp. UNOC14_S4 TaxID=2872340 RepID=UPI0027E2D941|nr:WbqC family protein [Streptomyces sp. UNOC14_S4]
MVLDDVQFTRRDYQHRTRLAALEDPKRRQWLTIPTHLPRGQRTKIREAVMAEPGRSRQGARSDSPTSPLLSGPVLICAAPAA